MSFYAQAAQQGMSAMQLAFTGENAITKQAYNVAYAETAQRLAAAEAKNVAESNISALTQDKILTDSQIEIDQDKAEAQAKLSAAVAGTSGQNVDQVVYLTEVNESLAKATNAAQTQQAINQQGTAVRNADITLSNVPDSKTPTAVDLMLPAVGSFVSEFEKGTLGKQSDAAASLWSV